MSTELGKKVVACLIVRMKSTRLPQKALLDVCGKPMVVRIIDHLKAAQTVDEIVVCTSDHPDDAILLDIAREQGVEGFAGSQDDVLSRILSVAKARSADILLRVTGDNVFTEPGCLDHMVKRHIQTNADYSRIMGLPWGVTAEALSASMLTRLAAMIPDPNQTEYLMLWAFDPKTFRCEILEAPENIRRPDYSLTVDTPEDIARARWLYSICEKTDGLIDLPKVVELLDADPSYAGISPDAQIKIPSGKTMRYCEFMAMLKGRAEEGRKSGTR